MRVPIHRGGDPNFDISKRRDLKRNWGWERPKGGDFQKEREEPNFSSLILG